MDEVELYADEGQDSDSFEMNTSGQNAPPPDVIPMSLKTNENDDHPSGSESFQSQWTSSLMSSTTEMPRFDHEDSEEDREEKMRLIGQILELQHTLEDLSNRVDLVTEENLKLRSENQILGQYIENLMAASAIFQSASPRSSNRAVNNQGDAVPQRNN